MHKPNNAIKGEKIPGKRIKKGRKDDASWLRACKRMCDGLSKCKAFVLDKSSEVCKMKNSDTFYGKKKKKKGKDVYLKK